MEMVAARSIVGESQIWKRIGNVKSMLLVEGCFSQFGLGPREQIKLICNANLFNAFKAFFDNSASF